MQFEKKKNICVFFEKTCLLCEKDLASKKKNTQKVFFFLNTHLKEITS